MPYFGGTVVLDCEYVFSALPVLPRLWIRPPGGGGDENFVGLEGEK